MALAAAFALAGRAGGEFIAKALVFFAELFVFFGDCFAELLHLTEPGVVFADGGGDAVRLPGGLIVIEGEKFFDQTVIALQAKNTFPGEFPGGKNPRFGVAANLAGPDVAHFFTSAAVDFSDAGAAAGISGSGTFGAAGVPEAAA